MHPKLKLTFEISIPNPEGGPLQRYAVSRSLKARWHDDPQKITESILTEIKKYHGSFVGDIIQTLHSLVRSEHIAKDSEKLRALDVARYAAALMETLIFSSIRDEDHKDLLENNEIFEWDGTTKNIDFPSREEIKNVDIEKVLTLLEPKLKHALFLISKDAKKEIL